MQKTPWIAVVTARHDDCGTNHGFCTFNASDNAWSRQCVMLDIHPTNATFCSWVHVQNCSMCRVLSSPQISPLNGGARHTKGLGSHVTVSKRRSESMYQIYTKYSSQGHVLVNFAVCVECYVLVVEKRPSIQTRPPSPAVPAPTVILTHRSSFSIIPDFIEAISFPRTSFQV